MKSMEKHIWCRIDCEGMEKSHEIVSFIRKVEKENKLKTSCESEVLNHSDASSWFLKLAKIENNNNEN